MRALVIRHRTTLEIAVGRLDDAEAGAFEAVRIGQEARDATTPIAFLGQLSIIRFYQGRAAEMESVWRGIVEQSPSVETFRAVLAFVLLEAGMSDEPLQIFDTLAASGFKNIPEDVQWMATMTTLGEISAAVGRREGTDELYEVMSRYPEGNATVGDAICYGPIARSLGIVASVLGRWEDAERHFLNAIELSEREDMRPSLAQGRMNYGDMLLRRDAPGDREKARAFLQQALEAAQQMGMPRVLADCERLLVGVS
jgi:tetratricopeptide (TPR) repeat protein